MEGAKFEKVIKIDVTSIIEPVVSCPDTVDNVQSVRKLKGLKIDQVFIGTCTNGRIEDLRIAARILKKKRHTNTRLPVIIPASQTIYSEALKEGLIKIFVDADAVVLAPGCESVCWCARGDFGQMEKFVFQLRIEILKAGWEILIQKSIYVHLLLQQFLQLEEK